jgi:hypothetical protein
MKGTLASKNKEENQVSPKGQTNKKKSSSINKNSKGKSSPTKRITCSMQKGYTVELGSSDRVVKKVYGRKTKGGET